MTRLDSFLLLLLAGIGWACGFALIGYAVFRGVPDNGPLAAIFGGFGFGAGVILAACRLALERELPRNLSGSLRAPQTAEPSAPHSPEIPSGSVSAFGA